MRKELAEGLRMEPHTFRPESKPLKPCSLSLCSWVGVLPGLSSIHLGLNIYSFGHISDRARHGRRCVNAEHCLESENLKTWL